MTREVRVVGKEKQSLRLQLCCFVGGVLGGARHWLYDLIEDGITARLPGPWLSGES
jgi:hypothetical protein